MAIIGGAIITPSQGALLDAFGVSLSYLLPLACFAIILAFAWTAHRRA
jgi:MFS transporter, FHS family, L-fucose permease